jgi:hypothetical protein
MKRVGIVETKRSQRAAGARPHLGEEIMKSTRWWTGLAVAAFGLSLTGAIGCQTSVGGMTLPSGYYLDHKPQYFPPDPDFPLPKELATMNAQDSLINGGGRAVEGTPK